LAGSLLGRGKSADREEAGALVSKALRTFGELGMQTYATSASALSDEVRAQRSGQEG